MSQIEKIVSCPYCNRGILFSINGVDTGTITGVCKYCRTKSSYDTETQKATVIARPKPQPQTK